jgi:RNA polymerase sigma-70 factor (ECF subfamily)
MAVPSQHEAAFAENRAHLWRVAYRMLGSRAEADDAVQDAWLRWHGVQHQDIRSPQAWLTTTITRLCIDRLKQLRVEREHYTGPWLPEPLVEEPPADQTAELASELSIALMALLERLAPEERAAFLLHDIFDTDYGEIAQILGKSEVACRQLVSRAARRVREQKPRVQVPVETKQRLLAGLLHALQTQDRGAMRSLLAEEAAWTSDGGGRARAARRVIRGAEKVARFGTGVFRKLIRHLEFHPVYVNNEPGLAVFSQGRLFSVMTIRTDGQRILDVFSILNPEKLEAVTADLGASSDS